MKRTFLIMLFLIFLFPSLAFAEGWEDFSSAGGLWDNQKPVTDKEFEDVMNALEAKKKAKEQKQLKKKQKKISGGGTSLHDELNPDTEIQSLAPLKENKDGELLNLTVDLVSDGKVLEKGFYKITGEKQKNGELFLCFYQSDFLKAKFKAYETKNDYGAETVDFVKLIPYNDDYVKVVFGSLNYNLYAYIRISKY